MKSKLFVIHFVLLTIVACNKENEVGICTDIRQVELSFVASIDDGITTKTTYDVANHVGLWKREDMAGVIASYGSGSFTDVNMQNFRIDGGINAVNEFLSAATFTGKLTDKGAQSYTYYAVYPYAAFQTVTDVSAVSSRLEERQFPDLKSWDGACDMLASKPLAVSSASVVAEGLELRFTRLFGMLRLRFGSSILDAYGSETVEAISIESSNPTDVLAGKFTVDLSSDDAPAPVMSTVTGEHFSKVTLDYRCKNANLADIDAYFVLCPGEYDEVTITVKTSAHALTLPRTGLSVSRGSISSATMNWKGGDTAEEAVSLLPKNPSSLKILTLGHSFVIDSMEYIDDLLNASGITNVTFANLYQANCSLQEYWGHITNEGNTKGGNDTVGYNKRYYNGETVTTLSTKKTIIDAICDEQWDVIVFQTSLENEGFYSKFCTTLNQVLDYVRLTCQIEHRSTPLFAWHMFWAMGSQYNSSRFKAYESNQEQNYAANIAAAKEVMRNHDIQLVIPTATTVQSIRHSSINNSYELTRDWYHMDIGAGRYAAACTWFEFFIKPCFGVSVLGNTFMPTAYTHMQVTEDNREFLQKAAVLACKYPFEISHLDEILPEDTPHEGDETDFNVVGSTENLSESSTSEQPEPFTLIDNLTW